MAQDSNSEIYSPTDPDAMEHAYARDQGEPTNPMAQLIRDGRYDDFNQQVAENGPADLSYAYLRMQNLTRLHLAKANLEGAYLRGADLRGQDLSTANLAGASLASANVSGVLFPTSIDAADIRMSLELGTRLRVK